MSEDTQSTGTDGLTRTSQLFLVAIVLTMILRGLFLTQIAADEIGVRQSNVSGVLEKDLRPGYQLSVIGLHRVSRLPSKFLFLNYTGQESFTIRTKDNNTVSVDVSIPYRIKPGDAWRLMKEGNHTYDASTRTYRFERFADRAATDVLNAVLSELSSPDFYRTDRRLEVSDAALTRLNEKLSDYHLEAAGVLIRSYKFRQDYEAQLAQIQLNEQQKLLDDAKSAVADKQQTLDNYEQQTNALVASKEQDWARRIAEIDRAYQVGLLELAGDESPGAARRLLTALSEDERTEIIKKATTVFGRPTEDVTDEHLLGIRNIQAETTEYYERVTAEAGGVKKRLQAEGNAKIAQVQGEYESRINALLNSPAGRAYVAYIAAGNVKFDDELTFQSDDGIPSVLRLREFAEKFMGK